MILKPRLLHVDHLGMEPTPKCTQCGGTERPVIRYPSGDVRCAEHLIAGVVDPRGAAK